MTLHELDESTSLARRNLDVCYLAKSLEEGAELVLGDIATKAADENGRVVGVGELVHRLGGRVVVHRRSAHRIHAHAAGRAMHAWHTLRSAGSSTLVLGSSCRDAHRAVATVDALHFGQRALLFGLVGEAHEAIAAGGSGDGVGHDFGGLAGLVLVLEQRQQDELSDVGTKVADEDGVLGSTITALAVDNAAARRPVELEWTSRVRDELAIVGQSLLGRLGRGEIDEAVASIRAEERLVLQGT